MELNIKAHKSVKANRKEIKAYLNLQCSFVLIYSIDWMNKYPVATQNKVDTIYTIKVNPELLNCVFIVIGINYLPR